MSNPAAKHPPPRSPVGAAIVCGIAGFLLFHFFGNATRGYIPSTSLFYWWGFQWVNPGSETEHGWLILGLSVWLWWRNVSKPETGNRKPETGERESEGRNRTAETANEGVTPPVRTFPVSGLRFPVLSTAPAVAALLAGLALHALGFAAQQTRLSIVAFLVFTWGVVRLGGGRRWGNAAMFPLAFMVFAIPISALDEIGLPLRLWVTSAGERIAHLAGIDVVRSGTQLVAPDGRFNYDVAAPCSGVRSLMALTALSVLIGYLNFRSWWRRGLVVGLSVPLVYLGNVARIVAIIFAAQAGGPVWGDRAHHVMGYGVFVIVLGGVLGAVAWIRKGMPEAGEESGNRKPETGNRRPETGDRRSQAGNWKPETGDTGASLPDLSPRTPVSGFRSPVSASAGVVVGVLILIGVEMLFLHRLGQMPPRGQVGVVLAADGLNPVELPAFLGTEWIGQRADVSAVEREILPPDTGFSRKNYAFVADRTKDVFLSIVLSGRDRTSIHRPELCLVGQGWTVVGAMQQAFRVPAADDAAARDFRATVLRVRREVPSARGRVVVPQLVAYWFVSGDTVVPSHWERFARDAWNRLTRARADRWAYVLMQTDARDGEAAALARMQAVLEGTLPVFQRPFAAD